MAREIAPTNQWKERKGARVRSVVLVDSTAHSGFVTFADEGTATAVLENSTAHSGFVTATDSTSGDADALLVGNGFVILNGST